MAQVSNKARLSFFLSILTSRKFLPRYIGFLQPFSCKTCESVAGMGILSLAYTETEHYGWNPVVVNSVFSSVGAVVPA